MKIKEYKKIITYLVICIVFIILTYEGYIFICKQFIYPIKYDKYVIDAAKINNVDPYLIFAIIKQESRFDKNVCSIKNAKGLMQLLDSTAKEMVVSIPQIDKNSIDLFDAKTNIYIGTRYFRTLIDRYNGNIRLAMCAYNAGLGNVDKWILSNDIYVNSSVNISNIPFDETKTYLVNILEFYDKYVKLYS